MLFVIPQLGADITERHAFVIAHLSQKHPLILEEPAREH